MTTVHAIGVSRLVLSSLEIKKDFPKKISVELRS